MGWQDQSSPVADWQRGSSPVGRQTPQDRARAAGQAAGAGQGGLLAAANAAAHSGTFGLSDYVGAGARYLGQRAIGVQNPDDFNTDLAFTRGIGEGSATAHPYASTAGDVAGALVPGAGLEKAVVKGAGLTSKLALKANEPIRNLLRLVGHGAIGGGAYGTVAGGADAAEHGGNASDIASSAATGGMTGAAAGAVTGPLAASAPLIGAAVGGYEGYKQGGITGGAEGAGLGATVGAGVAKLGPAQKRAFALLAEKIGMDGNTVARMAQEYRARTGQPPTIAKLLDAKQQADLADYTTARQSSGAKMQAANEADIAQLQQALPAQISALGSTKTPFAFGNKSTSANDALTAALDSEMDAAMGPRDPKSGKRQAGTLGTKVVGTAADAQAYHDLPDIVEAKNEVPSLVPLLNRALSSKDIFTVDDIDSLRQSLSKLQKTVGAANSYHADAIKRVRNDLVGGAAQLYPEYGKALDAYSRQEDFIDGFSHGYSGKAASALDASQKTPERLAGIELGARTNLVDMARKTEAGAVSTANQLRQGAPTKQLENLPSGERDQLQQLGTAETKARRSMDALSPSSLQSSGSESTQALHSAAELGVALHGRATTGFSTHAVWRALKQMGTSEKLANAITDNLIKPLRTPADDAALRNAINQAGLRGDKRRLILKQVSRYAGAGVGGATGAYAASTLRGTQQ